VVAISLTNMVSVVMTAESTSQNEFYANEIVEELRDYTRALDYSALEDNLGLHTLKVNSTDGGDLRFDGSVNSTMPPLLMDTQNRTWCFDRTATGRFADTNPVTYLIESGSIPDTLKISISVSYQDSYHQLENKVVTASVIKIKGDI
ncbi:MAG: hypothetical protein K2Z81_28650, partial [Cyanobacteria bacterium]|nr:hypothetical protein [Cyanobacteriota bacterium]